MRSFQNSIKNFERHYGVHFKSLRRSRRFMTLLLISLLILIYILYKISPRSKRTIYYTAELDSCMQKNLDKFSRDINLMNVVLTDGHDLDRIYSNKLTTIDSTKTETGEDINNDFYLPYTGNGYLGLSLKNKKGIFINFPKSLNLNLNFNPLVEINSNRLTKSETSVVDIKQGIVHLIQCFQSDMDCLSVQNSLYVHRTRPSLIIEEIVLNNPSKDPITFDVLQIGAINWENSKNKIKKIDGEEFSITSGIIDVTTGHKIKHLYVSVGTLRLPVTTSIKEREFFKKYTVITIVKYSTNLLSGKSDKPDPIINELESSVVNEIKNCLMIGYNQLKKEHINAWENIWKTGFGISNSLALGVMNGNHLNASMYYILANNRAPFHEVGSITGNLTTHNNHQYKMERCYEGFSTLHAVKLWKLPQDEFELFESNRIWSLTLQKHGCGHLLDLGVTGILQAIVLSLGGFKFTHHHLDLNLNPRQLHRDYQFRNINYGNLSLLNIDVEVGYDNHAVLYVELNELIDINHKFYACDAGCIDPPVELQLNKRQEFPVKLTNPITAILYISSDKEHIDELKHALHVQEVDIAPPQDVDSIAIHRHGHQMAGFATLFWTIFVSLIIIFHLFLIKLVYRELCANDNTGSYETVNSNIFRKRFARTV